MGQEIELKFEIDESSIKSLSNFLQAQPGERRHIFHLTNRYYDSLDKVLRHHGVSIRIRGIHEDGKKDEYELTLKSSSQGTSLAGLHTRQEYNVPLADNQLDLSGLPQAALPSALDLDTLTQQLKVLFSTDFQRKTWLIYFNQSQIEVALDQGIISNGRLSTPILEIELELKLGSQVDLLLLAYKLSQFNLHLFSQSKAARGYRLIEGNALPKIPELTLANLSRCSVIATILEYWQTNEEYALANSDLNFYRHTLQQVAQQIRAVLPLSQNEYSTQLNQIYCHWLAQIELITMVKIFAFSQINTQFKLSLMLLIL